VSLLPATIETQALAVREQSAPPIADILKAVVDRGISQENVGALEKIVGLYERMQAKDAERQFASAFVQLQADLPTIVARTVIPNRGKYERFEDVMDQVQPVLTKHGFGVSFSMAPEDSRITVTCHLRHVGGHSESKAFTVRTGRKADSDTQADCMAATTAKRNALLQSLNIVVRQDCLSDEDNAAIEGGPITKEQAFELERRVGETNSNAAAFLKYAKADKFSAIKASMYPVLDQFLSRKEKGGK